MEDNVMVELRNVTKVYRQGQLDVYALRVYSDLRTFGIREDHHLEPDRCPGPTHLRNRAGGWEKPG